MAFDKDIRFELIARLCPNSTGADIRSVCTEAGMFAIRARRKSISEKDLMEAIDMKTNTTLNAKTLRLDAARRNKNTPI
jgi:ATP-dependent 26S proteasome regulatory subunit